jgi:hypothetical protein
MVTKFLIVIAMVVDIMAVLVFVPCSNSRAAAGRRKHTNTSAVVES